MRWTLLVAVGLLLPDTRMAAAVCSLALMLAMFGANVYASRMADPTGYAGAAPSRSFPWPPP
ncbi:DoxX family protein [Mycobacterium tuberculosis]|nr:DoxX family protein [Mycobacterium tuberculosis]CLA35962.1 DoxX family protein [Mycobacterium tuberculosis]